MMQYQYKKPMPETSVVQEKQKESKLAGQGQDRQHKVI